MIVLILIFLNTFACSIDNEREEDIFILYMEPYNRLEALSEISDDHDGITRTFLSEAHKQSAKLIAEWMKEAGVN